jgi:hypothetical protein
MNSVPDSIRNPFQSLINRYNIKQIIFSTAPD